jgi:NAD(P)-dependent dehydrogenase (short-subunit alcohol dehydrogenase family)
MADQLVLRPAMPGDDLDALGPALTGAFTDARAALEGGRPVVVVLSAADLEGQGTPVDAALATGILGMVRTLGIEGAKPGWRINVVAAGEGDEEAVEETIAVLAGSSLTGQLLQVGGANLGKVVA